MGATASLLFTLFGWWWVAPLPLALAVVLYQVFFWHRGDRPVHIELTDVLTLTDPVRGTTAVIDPRAIRAVTLHVRPHLRTPEHDVHVQLATDEAVVFACRMRCDKRPEPGPGIVDGEAMDLIVGGWSRAVRDLADGDGLCRQIVRDTDLALLGWLRERVDPACFGTVALRLWQGEEPELDLLGHLVGAPDRLLLLPPRPLRAVVTGATRTAELLRWREEQQISSGEVPLLLVHLPDETVAFPSTLAGTLAPRGALEESTTHTQLVCGQALIWRLMYNQPREAWPEPLATALGQAGETMGLQPERLNGARP